MSACEMRDVWMKQSNVLQCITLCRVEVLALLVVCKKCAQVQASAR
jgi:hypothetical protein